jgi:hypothetical protein
MLSAQLEPGATSRVVFTRPSHGKHIDPFANTRKASVLQFLSVTFRMLSRFYIDRPYQGRMV